MEMLGFAKMMPLEGLRVTFAALFLWKQEHFISSLNLSEVTHEMWKGQTGRIRISAQSMHSLYEWVSSTPQMLL